MNEVVKKAQALITRGRLEKAIEYLLTIDDIQGETRDMIASFSATYDELNRKIRFGIISSSEEQLTRSKLTHSLLGLLRDLKEEGLESGKTLISFFASNPQNGMGDLRLNEEFDRIEESRKRSVRRDDFHLNSTFILDTYRLYQVLLDEKPNIVHFAGHGVSSEGEGGAEGTRSIAYSWEEDSNMSEEVLEKYTGGIALKNADGKVEILWADQLSALFSEFSDHIKCVFLNACHSELQAAAIIEHIDYVIGMNKEVPDQTAMNFSLFFYDALWTGESIEDSFAKAKKMLSIMRMPGAEIPTLIKRNPSV